MNTQKHTETVLLTQDEAAHLLRISRTTLWRLCKRGSLVSVAVAGRTHIRHDSLMSYIESQTHRG